MDVSQVNRLEIIDHTSCWPCGGLGVGLDGEQCETCHGIGCTGRTVIFHDGNKQVDLELQDDKQTLKIFIHPRLRDFM